MRVTITVDGEPVDHDIDLDVEALTMKRAVRLEKVMGADRCARLLGGDASLAMMPSTIQALVYVQIADMFPGLQLDDFDFDLGDLAVDEDEPETSSVVELPMALPDGTVVEGASSFVDPTKGAETG